MSSTLLTALRPLLTAFTKYPKLVAGRRDPRGGPGQSRPVPSVSCRRGGIMKMMRVVLTLILVGILGLSLPGATSLAHQRYRHPDGQSGPARGGGHCQDQVDHDQVR